MAQRCSRSPRSLGAVLCGGLLLVASCGSTDSDTTNSAGNSSDDSILAEVPVSTISIGGVVSELPEAGLDPAPFGPGSEPVLIAASADSNIVVFLTADLAEQGPTGEVMLLHDGQVWEGSLDLSSPPVITGAGTLQALDESQEPTGDQVEVELVFKALLGSSQIVLDGNQATLSGDLGSHTTLQVRHLIDNHPEVDTLVLSDIGGSVDDDANMESGRLVRAAGYTTIVHANAEIYSGGVDLFAAGVERIVEEGATLGVHSWCCGPDGESAHLLSADHPGHDAQLSYFTEMLGDDGDGFYWFTIKSAPYEGEHVMTIAELEQHRLATSIDQT